MANESLPYFYNCNGMVTFRLLAKIDYKILFEDFTLLKDFATLDSMGLLS